MVNKIEIKRIQNHRVMRKGLQQKKSLTYIKLIDLNKGIVLQIINLKLNFS